MEGDGASSGVLWTQVGFLPGFERLVTMDQIRLLFRGFLMMSAERNLVHKKRVF